MIRKSENKNKLVNVTKNKKKTSQQLKKKKKNVFDVPIRYY